MIGLVVFATIFLSTRAKAREKPMNIARWKRRGERLVAWSWWR